MILIANLFQDTFSYLGMHPYHGHHTNSALLLYPQWKPEIGLLQNKPTLLNMDNQSAIDFEKIKGHIQSQSILIFNIILYVNVLATTQS